MIGGSTYCLAQIARIIESALPQNAHPEAPVRIIFTDSRQPFSGNDALFFALRTQRSDGHRYIAELYKKGVRYFVVEENNSAWQQLLSSDPCFSGSLPDDATKAEAAVFIQVKQPLEALQKLAAFHRQAFRGEVLGITGSNGKTVVKEWLFQLLSNHKRILRSPRSFNSQLGVPLSVWPLEPAHELGIFEAGISQTGEMTRLQAILRPGTGVFTHIGPAHDAGFASMEEKMAEKLILFNDAECLVFRSDDKILAPFIRRWASERRSVSLFGWGRDEEADLRILSMDKLASATRLRLGWQDKELELTIPFADEASFENAMHCIALILRKQWMEPGELTGAMARLQPLAMRMEMKEGIRGCHIINDAYSADLHSLNIALDFLRTQAMTAERVLILSEMEQTGMVSAELYQRMAVMTTGVDPVMTVLIGPDISRFSHWFGKSVWAFNDTESFLKSGLISHFSNQIILLKGARSYEFERIGRLLEKKDHQTLLEIDLDALVHNLNVFRNRLGREVRIMGMVKAFSYGSGSAEIASVLQYHRVDYLAVAFADEGKEMRQAGITMPIVVMNPEVRNFDTLFHYNLEPEVYSLKLLERLKQDWTNWLSDKKDADSPASLDLHIKLDTGMHRLGFQINDCDELLASLKGFPGARVASVFTHMAASDEPWHDDFSHAQITQFEQACDKLKRGLGYSFLMHMANSAAALRFPRATMDMVRLGIGLYGVSPEKSLQGQLQHVSTFKSVVSQVKKLQKGQTAGYSRAGVALYDMEIAIVPLGYADGLNRRLGNGRGSLWVRGQLAPLFGNISMDMCTLDVTGLQVTEGDEVIVFGPQKPVWELAADLETIPYEVLTSVSQRVKRVYYRS